jgi:DNA-directed RNA polymerase I subunit RPA2
MPALVTARPPVAEAGPSKGSRRPSFSTLKREAQFRHPSPSATNYPELHRLVAPHIDSFNALFDSAGLLETGIKDIQPKVVWDGKGKEGERGNRLESELNFCATLRILLNVATVKVENVVVGRPMVPDRAGSVKDRRIFPNEVRIFRLLTVTYQSLMLARKRLESGSLRMLGG